MSTQVKPLSSGSFQTVTKNGSTGTVADSSANISTIATSGLQHAALRAANMWVNVAGAASTAASSAQKVAHAAGIVLQEV